MHNYYAGLVWKIDKILLAISVVVSLIVLLSTFFKTRSDNIRNNNLRKIKKNIRAMAISGGKPGEETYPVVTANSDQEFLDVEMNRESILFNEAEQTFIKKCFSLPEHMILAEEAARKPGNKWRRIEAILSLGYTKDSAAIETIIYTLKDRDEDVAYYSLLALGMMKNMESAKYLLGLLKDKRFSAHKIISILGAFPSEISGEVIKLIDSADASIRSWAVRLLAKFTSERFTGRIIGLIKDPFADVRAAACDFMGKFSSKEVIGVLEECLSDKVWFVRMHAVRALSAINGPGAMQAIAGAIRDDSFMVKESVKSAMVKNIDVAIPFIKEILFSGGELSRREAVEALEVSGYTTRLLGDIISEDIKKRTDAADFLKLMINSAAHFGIEAALFSFGKSARDKIVQALRAVNDPFAEHLDKKIKNGICEL